MFTHPGSGHTSPGLTLGLYLGGSALRDISLLMAEVSTPGSVIASAGVRALLLERRGRGF